MSYDSDVSTVTTALIASNPVVFSESTISSILALSTKINSSVGITNVTPDADGNVTVPTSSQEVIFVNTSQISQTIVKPPLNAPVVIFQGRGGVVATFNDPVTVPSGTTNVDRVIIGSAGNDKIVIQDAKNTKIVLGTGDSSVQTGGGVDTIQAGLGNSTITGGSGDYAVVKLAGNADNFTVTSQKGHAVVTNKASGKTTDITKIQYVSLDGGNALIFAKDSVESNVANLYYTAFGRDADPGGLNFFYDAVKGGSTMKQVASAFASSNEFSLINGNKTDIDFVNSLYKNTFNRNGEEAGVNFYLDLLKNGASRADLIVNFATVATENNMSVTHTEATVVGSVMVVTGIV